MNLYAVRIHRLGAAARAFDPAAVQPPLPAWRPQRARLDRAGDRLLLDYPLRPGHLYYVFLGPDLVQWQFQVFPDSVQPPLDASALLGRERWFFFVLGVETEP